MTVALERIETEPDLFGNPVHLCKALWPHTRWYDKELEFIAAVRDAACTVVVAGNELGKDFTLARVCLAFWVAPWVFFPAKHFVAAQERADRKDLAKQRGCSVEALEEFYLHERRVVTTSVKADHLDVLWGEIGIAVRTCLIYDQLKQKYVFNDKEVRFSE